MFIKGRWFTEPEIIAYVNELEASRAESIKLLGSAMNDVQRLGYGDCASCRYAGQCSEGECRYEWHHQAEAEELIGKEAKVCRG